jgi:hypothetical protein
VRALFPNPQLRHGCSIAAAVIKRFAAQGKPKANP